MPQPNLEYVARAYSAEHGLSLVGAVGSGAFKQTFHVRDAAHQSFALKVYQKGYSSQRTEREAAALQRCSHPNIAKLSHLALFTVNEATHLISVEEFVAGGTLSSKMQTQGNLTAAVVLELGKALIGAVEHIASLDLVHRDIKPDNVLLRADGITPVIVDFGLVRDLRAESITQTWLLQGPGTPLYAPPEQLRNEKSLIDWRSDQFSLGVLLSYAAFGFHPYEEIGEAPQVYIERAANRGEQVRRFTESAVAAGLSCLIPMTRPWPVHRYRTPSELSRAWARQSGAS